MTDDDIDNVEVLLDWLLEAGPVGPVLVLSPSSQELEMLRRKGLAMEAYFREQWDLSGPDAPPGVMRQIALACNVFMCSPDPLAWMRAIARRARVLVIQDLIRSRRTEEDERAWEDGDIMRYQFSADEEMAATQPSFDMSRLVTFGPRYFYPADGPTRKFVCAVDLWRLP